jgi:threonine/homoserine/homoserine lactone efflux protein
MFCRRDPGRAGGGGMEGEAEKIGAEPERIDSTFRNGSLTAIGVVVGFSLGFLSSWATSDGEWNRVDLVSVCFLLVGISLKIRALAGMLGVRSLILSRYERLIRIFMIGLMFTAAGVFLAVFGDIVGLDQHVLKR